MTKPTLPALAVTTSLFVFSTASADPARNPSSLWYLSDQPSGWYYDGFLGIEREPTYTGSDRYETEADANFRALYRADSGHRYFISIGEAGALYELGDDRLFAAVLEYEEAREIDDDPALEFFDEGEDTLEAQLTLAKRWGNWTLAGVFQPDILDRGKGLVYFVGLGYDRMLTDRLRLASAIDVSFGDSEHLDTEVGISRDVAARSGLDAYSPDGGYKSTSLRLDLGYQFARDLELVFQSEFEFYGSEMADSPLVAEEGDDINTELGLTMRYRF